MHFSMTYERPEEVPGSGPVRVGWLLTDDKSGIIYAPPERLRSVDTRKTHAKSASRCPAVINLESRYFVVRCPFDLKLGFARDKDGKAVLRNLLGDQSPVRRSKLPNLVFLVGENEWRYPDKPTVQMSLPYLFIADEPVYLSQVAPFLHYRREPWPGTIFGGRFPINIWVRPIIWAFEWHDIERPLELSRGEPLFYCLFETEPADRPVQVLEAARTPELQEYLDLISGAVNYVNQTFSLFKAAEARRPSRLLTPRERG